jgi:hypothetical protein
MHDDKHDNTFADDDALDFIPLRGSRESWYLAANFGDNREMRSVGNRGDQTVHASSNFP